MSNLSNLTYSQDFEQILKSWAEKCESLSILHLMSYDLFNKYSVYVNIPIIVISSLIGFLNPINLGIPEQPVIIGSISILMSIFKTFDSYFAFSSRAEKHKQASNQYSKISKFIQLQLSLERQCRIIPRDLYDIIENELDNIKEAEPLIVKSIIDKFNMKYKDYETNKPAIVNGLTIVKINKPTEEQLQIKGPDIIL